MGSGRDVEDLPDLLLGPCRACSRAIGIQKIVPEVLRIRVERREAGGPTKVPGRITEAESHTLESISLDKPVRAEDTPPASPDFLLPVATALADIPALALTEAEACDLSHGQAISLVALMGRIPRAADPDGGLARAMAGSRVIGLCRLEEGWLKPARLL